MKTYFTRAGIFRKPKMLGYGGSWDGVSNSYSDPPSGYSNSFTGDGAGELTYSNDNSFQGNGEQQSGGIFKGNSSNLGANIVDAGVQLGSAAVLSASNKQVNQKTGWTPDGHHQTRGAAQGIATGWSIGNKIYPGIGGIIGAFAGGIYGNFRGKKLDKQAKQDWEGNNALFRQKEQLAMQGQAYNQWSKEQGNPQTQMYKYGGKMRKYSYKTDKSLKPPSFDGLSTTEYLEPNTIAPDPIKFVKEFGKIGVETALDQSSIGKGVNSTNVVRDFLENRNMGNAINIGLETIKFGTGVSGDFGSNLAQEIITEAQNSKYQRVGLPGAASQAEEYHKLKLPTIKSVAKHPQVPASSSTFVKKPLMQRGNGGSLKDTKQNPPKVYTDRKQFEQAQRMYNDSLILHNASKGMINDLKLINKLPEADVVWSKYTNNWYDKNTKQVGPAFNRLKKANKETPIGKGYEDPKFPYNYAVEYKMPIQPVVYQPHTHPIQKISRLNYTPYPVDSTDINIQGQEVRVPIPKQQGNPIYGPGRTIIGYSNNMHFTPAFQYTGAPNNELNLQDKALLENPDALRQYVSKLDNYKFQNGGSLRKLSSDSVEVQGPSHENGGVDLPMHDAEVEGNETIHKDYVFSDRLGFASVHKKMAKSKGIIENKPISFERVASLKAIADKEQKLKLIQEQMKAQYNLK